MILYSLIKESLMLEPKIEDSISDRKIVDYYKEQIKNGKHRPILINQDNEILDGNHTAMAYKELHIEPKEVYIANRSTFLQTASELAKNKPNNLGLETIYKMIADGTAKRL